MLPAFTCSADARATRTKKGRGPWAPAWYISFSGAYFDFLALLRFALRVLPFLLLVAVPVADEEPLVSLVAAAPDGAGAGAVCAAAGDPGAAFISPLPGPCAPAMPAEAAKTTAARVVRSLFIIDPSSGSAGWPGS